MTKEEEKCKATEHYEQITSTNLATIYRWEKEISNNNASRVAEIAGWK